MNKKLSDIVKESVELVDDVLQPMISPNEAFPPIEVLSLMEYSKDILGIEGDFAKEFFRKRSRYAVIPSLKGDVIYLNMDSGDLSREINHLNDDIARVIMYHAIHARVSGRGKIQDIANKNFAKKLNSNPISCYLRDALAVYLTQFEISHPYNRTFDMKEKYLDEMIMNRGGDLCRKLASLSFCDKRSDSSYGIKLDDFESRYYFKSGMFGYCVASIFGVDYLADLALNPLKKYVMNGFDFRLVNDQGRLFRVTENEINNPIKFFRNRLG